LLKGGGKQKQKQNHEQGVQEAAKDNIKTKKKPFNVEEIS